MASIKAGSAVKYITLPGIIPRLRSLFFDGFSMLAYYVALIYGMAKIIPAGHPYLNQANIGRFGVIQAVLAAWKNLDLKWKNIDRIIFFFALVSGLVLLLAYILGAIFFLITAPAMAAGGYPQIGQLFTNPNPENDIAFMMMDRMLGIPGIFNSKVVTTTEFGVMPTPFHHGLHALFAYFSWAMFGIAVLMFLYFVVEIVLETTITGTPFGKHFENIWTPFRIVAGLGLLIPVAYGLNSAQWITLYVAKTGSNFATNAWIAFNEGMENPMGMSNSELVALPTTPDFTGLAKDLFTIRACRDVDKKLKSGKSANSTAANSDDIVVTAVSKNADIDAYFVEGNRYFTILGRNNQVGKSWPAGYNSNFLNIYLEGLRFYKGKDIKIVFGRFSEEALANNTYPGGVEPVCGSVLIPNLLPVGQEIPTGNIQNSQVNEGVLIGASQLYAVMKMILGISKTGFESEGDNEDEYDYFLMRYATDRYYYLETSQGQERLKQHRQNVLNNDTGENPDCMQDDDNDGIDNDGDLKFDELGKCTKPVAKTFFINLGQKYQRYLAYGPIMGYDYYTGQGQASLNKRCAAIDCGRVVSGASSTCQKALESCQKARDGYAAFKPLPSVYYKDLGQVNPFLINRSIDSGLFKYGWGGAGIWYKIIAERNGSLTGATNTLPRATQFPLVMETVSKERTTTDQKVSLYGCERFNPAKSGDTPISLPGNVNDSHEMAKLYYNLCSQLQLNENMTEAGTTPVKTNNPILDIVNSLFGAKMLFNFRENSGVNPMAQLAVLGRALLDKAIISIAIGAGGSAVSGLMSLFGSAIGGPIGQIAAGGSEIIHAISKIAVSFAFIGLAAGVLLYYVIPFLPFMYFFFAVGTWVKTIFEALVGVPLWAMAHVRLDGGPGFSGKAASGGYFMLLEIFIRPIVTLLAFVASMFIFMALASMMNTVWGLVTANLVGFDPMQQISSDPLNNAFYRPRLDQFFFTIVYIIFMYMLATGSFKLIDQIPDSILRWISEAKSWGVNDSADEMVSNISQTVGIPLYTQAQSIVPKGVDLLHQAPASVGGSMGALKDMAAKLANSGNQGPPQG